MCRHRCEGISVSKIIIISLSNIQIMYGSYVSKTYKARLKVGKNIFFIVSTFPDSLLLLLGTQQEINKALELIRRKFPEDTYPDITLEEFPISQPIACPLRQELFQVSCLQRPFSRA